MIDISTIKTAMLGVNGWKQSLLSGAPVVDATNLATSSGAYYNSDFSNLVTVDNVVNTYETTGLTDEQVNTLLTEIVDSASTKVLNAVFSDDDFIQNNILFPYEYDFTHTLTNDTSFVGYEITTPKAKDILNIINSLSLTFNDVDTVKILLFHSSKKDPVKEVEVTTVQDDETKQELTDWYLSYTNSIKGGKWYVGYLRSGLTALAYDRDYESANIMNGFYCVGFNSIQVLGHNTETLFDVNDIEYTSETYGMNFDISTFKHYDSIITENKNRFSKALGLQVAANALDMIINNNRSNDIERSLRTNAVLQLEGFERDGVKTIGILKKLDQEIENLKNTFLGMPKIQINTLR